MFVFVKQDFAINAKCVQSLKLNRRQNCSKNDYHISVLSWPHTTPDIINTIGNIRQVSGFYVL